MLNSETDYLGVRGRAFSLMFSELL